MAGRQGLRIAFFGTSGLLSSRALDALSAEHCVVAVIRPASRAGRLGRVLAAVRAVARGGPPQWTARSGDDPDIGARLSAMAPDLVCTAGYPWLLPDAVYAGATLGGVNVHASLLPRHRGILPLFWIYYHDDRETGVTVHRLAAGADTGDILGQSAFPLERGFPVEELNRRNAERGAELLRDTVRAIAAGKAQPRAQREADASPAPMVKPGRAMVDFAGWPAERVWHFLAGLYPRFIEPLATPDGAPAAYAGVLGYRDGPATGPPGTLSADGAEWRLQCRDGWVRLARNR